MTRTDHAMTSDIREQTSRFLTVADTARELSVSTKYVRRAIERGELLVHRFGRAIRIARSDFEQFIAQHRP